MQLPPDLDTPAVLVEVDRMLANVRRQVEALKPLGVALRPHAKTHKSVAVARLLIDAGAQGITTATLSEAEVFASAGIDDIFVAYPVWAVGPKAQRLRRVASLCRLRIGADSVEGVRTLAAAADGVPLEVLVEIDSGDGRTGARTPQQVSEITAAALSAGVRIVGAFTHGGHGYRGPDATAPAADDEVRALAWARTAIEEAGGCCTVLSAGATPTSLRAPREGLTEERPGTFVFGDGQQVMLGSVTDGDLALVVAATVVSSDGERQVVLDSGAKTLSKDRHPLLEGFGRILGYPHLTIANVNDHHAMVDCGGGPLPALGEVVAVVPNHVCPVVNLTDELVVTREGAVLDRWPVDARARNS